MPNSQTLYQYAGTSLFDRRKIYRFSNDVELSTRQLVQAGNTQINFQLLPSPMPMFEAMRYLRTQGIKANISDDRMYRQSVKITDVPASVPITEMKHQPRHHESQSTTERKFTHAGTSEFQGVVFYRFGSFGTGPKSEKLKAKRIRELEFIDNSNITFHRLPKPMTMVQAISHLRKKGIYAEFPLNMTREARVFLIHDRTHVSKVARLSDVGTKAISQI